MTARLARPMLGISVTVVVMTAMTVGCTAPGRDESVRLTPPNDAFRSEAFRTVRDTAVFSFGSSNGPPGTIKPPKTVVAFRDLLKSDAAGREFHDLLAQSTPAGRLYALCGLYLTDRAEFDRVAPTFARNNEMVDAQFGCITAPRRFNWEVCNPKRGRFDPNAGQSISTWAERNRGDFADIVGGWASRTLASP